MRNLPPLFGPLLAAAVLAGLGGCAAIDDQVPTDAPGVTEAGA